MPQSKSTWVTMFSWPMKCTMSSKRAVFLKIRPNTKRYEIIFWTQNRMFCKLCRIAKRDLGFIVVAHRFLKKEKVFTFDKVDHWILIVSRHWWETSPVFGYFGSWKKWVAVVENDFWRMTFKSTKLLALYHFSHFIPAYYGQSFLFRSKLRQFPYLGGVFFFGNSVQVLPPFWFSPICSE